MGGGVVGLTLAHLLLDETVRGANISVAVVEPRPPMDSMENTENTDSASIDLRVAALAPAASEMFQRLGVWDELPASKRCRYERMRVWQGSGGPAGPRAIEFDAATLGQAELGHIVENKALRNALWQRLVQRGECTFITGERAARLCPLADAVDVEFAEQRVRARLLVGADGANSWVREQLGVELSEQSYAQHALVCHVETERPHAATAWQKFLPAGPVALLPLQNGLSSLVWSVATETKDDYLGMSDAEFARELSTAFDAQFGDLKCASMRVAFPLARAHAKHYTGRRFALLGDAAHRVHPLAGQGLNLGLHDAAALADELGRHLQLRAADPGDPLALRRYERRRKGDNLLTMRAMDALNGLFRSTLADAGGAGMHALGRFDSVKRLLARHAMGIN